MNLILWGNISLSLCLMICLDCSASSNEFGGYPDAKNCSLSVPPENSGTNSLHGVFLFVYPRVIPVNFTGCQLMWDENGFQWMGLYFERGEPALLRASFPENFAGGAKYYCKYADQKLVDGDAAFCSEFDKKRPFGGLAFESNPLRSSKLAAEKLIWLRNKIR